MKYQARINAKISDKDKEKLEAIKKEHPHISIRLIIEDFINNYCETEPTGVKLKIKEIENNLKEIEDNIDILYENKAKLEIQLKTYKDKLNEPLNDEYIDPELAQAIESITNICNDQNYNNFESIPHTIFVNIAKNNRTNVEKLKQEVLEKLFQK